MNHKRCYIYALEDPRHPGIPYYVGKSNHPEKRLRDHVRLTLTGRPESEVLGAWIRSLAERGLSPQLSVLAAVPVPNWQEEERSWIVLARRMNPRLLNVQPGGEGITDHGPAMRVLISTGRRRAMAEGRGVWSDRTREEIRAKFSGQGNPFFGRCHTADTKKRISERKRAAYAAMSPAQRERVFAYVRSRDISGDKNPMFGRKLTEESRCKMRARWAERRKLGLRMNLSEEARAVRRRQAASMRERKRAREAKHTPDGRDE